jgi:hypothetical protein
MPFSNCHPRCKSGSKKRRTIWIADAHRYNGKHFVARAHEKLTAFLELESAIYSGQRLAAAIG